MQHATRQAAPAAPALLYLGLEVPLALRELVSRHHAHLSALIDNLSKAGIGADDLQRHVDALIAAYRAELSQTLASMLDGGSDVGR